MNVRHLTVAALLALTLTGCSSSTPTPDTVVRTDENLAGPVVIPAETDENGEKLGPDVPARTPGKPAATIPVNPLPTTKPSNDQEDVGYGHAEPDPARKPAEAGLPSSGIPGTYLGAVPQSEKNTSYRWDLTPAKTRSDAKTLAVEALTKVEAKLVGEGWLPLSPRSEVQTVSVSGSDAIDAIVTRAYTREGVAAMVIVRRSVAAHPEYNSISIGVTTIPAEYRPDADASTEGPSAP